MSSRFYGKCFGCGEQGHRKADCPNRDGGDTESVDESVYRQPPAFGGQDRTALYNAQYGGPAGGFGGVINPPQPFYNQQQQQQQYQPPPPPPQYQQYQQQQPQQQQQQQQGPVAPLGIPGVPMVSVSQRHFAVGGEATEANVSAAVEAFKEQTGNEHPHFMLMSEQSAREVETTLASHAIYAAQVRQRNRDRVRGRPLNIVTLAVPAGAVSDGPMTGQAGRGALPGARTAQNERAGAGLLGQHRVERPGADRRQGQQQRLTAGHGGKGAGDGPGGRSVHTDHPPGMACKTCSRTGHTEADCAKPTSRAWDSTYCPYHRTTTGSEEHKASKCHKSVDKCWAEMLDDEGRPLSRVEADRLVAEFVFASRGGRPEPRCEHIHNHWAMCVARHIRSNGGGDAIFAMLPVRRVEVKRRADRRELSWEDFDHSDVAASRVRFCDPHWESADVEELVAKLEEYARTGVYKPKSKRKAQGARHDAPAEEQGGADADNASARDGATVVGSPMRTDPNEAEDDANEDISPAESEVSGDAAPQDTDMEFDIE